MFKLKSWQKLTVFMLVFLFVLTNTNLAFAVEDIVNNSEAIVEVDNLQALNNSDISITAENENSLSITDNSIENLNSEFSTDQQPIEENSQSQSLLLSEEDDSVYSDSYNTIKAKLKIDTDSPTGALNYTYPITVPPGRNNFQPDLSLNYNNQNLNNESVFGYGWSINIPYIERINKNGVEKMFNQYYFNSSLSGELVQIASSTSFKAKVETGDFLKYEFIDNEYWQVSNKEGSKYLFGISSSTRQDDPASSTRIFKWMLEKITDSNNNNTTYVYFKDHGQIYPSTIKYSGNEAEEGIYEIDFSRETQSDISSTTNLGFPVKTNYRINQILIKVNNSWQIKYELAYQVADYNTRSLLESVTKIGQDEQSNITNFPEDSFYYQVKEDGWQQSGGWSIPVYFVNTEYEENGSRLADVNGDGLPDIIKYPYVYMNNGDTSGWSIDESWEVPIDFDDVSSLYGCKGARLADVNGDGLVDILKSTNNTYNNEVYINNGTGWDLDENWEIPLSFNEEYTGSDWAVYLAEVNGDGFIDIVQSISVHAGNFKKVFINKGDGTGWQQDSHYYIPVYFKESGYDNGTRLTDVNSDGLDDIIKYPYVYTNKGDGTGWELESSWVVPIDFETIGAPYYHKDNRLADINGDGLVDILRSTVNSYYNDVYINNGSNWVLDENWEIPVAFSTTYTGGDLGVRFSDVNGDGLVDVVQSMLTGPGIKYKGVYLAKPFKSDILNKIKSKENVEIRLAYKNTPEYLNTSDELLNPNLPISLQTVFQIDVNDGLGNVATTTYTYEGGKYYYEDPFDRKVAGFKQIAQTDSLGNISKNYYHQGDTSSSTQGEYSDHISKLGKVYRTEVYDNNDNLYSKTINKWENYDLGNDRDFVYLSQTVASSYDGDTDHKDKAQTFTYENTYGNLIQKTNWGEVTGSDDGTFTDTGSDLASTTLEYVASTSLHLVGLPSREITVDQSDDKIKETKYYYDGLSVGEIAKGNMTKEEHWVSDNDYIDFEKTYNDYGLVVEEKDPLDNITNYTYDEYNLFVATTTNALDQTLEYYYDYSLGKPKIVIDQNGHRFETVYDGLDRVIEEKIPDSDNPETLVTKTTYEYFDFSSPRSVQKTAYLNDATSTATFTYLDGLDRVIQERRQAEDDNIFSVKDLAYNPEGLLEKESLAYFSTGTTTTEATASTSLYSEYLYDPLQRVTTIHNVLGTTTNTYDQWGITVIDPLGNTKILTKDAYENLVEVNENNGTSTYTTYYDFDLTGNLLKITDALGNVRNFEYDGLKQLIKSEDLHAALDTTFGSSTFAYDEAGNLIIKTDANNQVVEYTYDDLNRVTSEDYLGQTGTEIVYGYDSCENGASRLCSATTTDVVSRFTYDPQGLTKTEVKIIGEDTFATGFEYDRQGNLLEIAYPDNAQVSYLYNNAGLLEKVLEKESGESYYPVIVDYDYNPLGMKTREMYANGAEGIYTYDPEQLYRLENKTTVVDPAEQYQMASLNKGLEPIYITSLSDSNSEEMIAANNTIFTTNDLSANGLKQLVSSSELFKHKYRLAKNTLIKKKETLNEPDVILGNFNNDKFIPELALGKWQGETIFRLKPKYIEAVAINDLEVANNVIKFKTENQEFHFYDLEASTDLPQGGFEVEAVLNSKPDSNKVFFSISSENLEFYYQAPLNEEKHTDKNIDHCTETECFDLNGKLVEKRPENIVGSYAVYYATKKGDYTRIGGQNYDTGKAFHIYRPRIIDSQGEWTWGEMNIDQNKGLLTITIPAKFLDVANYPITVDPTFGYESVGGSWGYAGDKIVGSEFTGDEGTVESITAYGDLTVGGVNFKYGIYDSGDLSLVGETSSASSISDEWKTLSLTETAEITATDYLLAIWGSETTDSISPKYDTGAANQGFYKYLTYTGSYPDPLTSPSYDTKKYSIYATYSLPPEPATSTIQDLSYTYDAVGNITGILDQSETLSAKTIDFDYDDLYRLITASSSEAAASNYREDYSYNAIGNILSKSDLGNYTYTDNGYNNPHAVTDIDGIEYEYDNNGNLTADGTWNYAWDYNNRLTEASTVNSGTTTESTYIYDDALSSGWSTGWSWNTTVTNNSTEQVYTGTYAVKAVFNQAWGGLYFHKTSVVDLSSRDMLSFAVHGGATGGQEPDIELFDNEDQGLGTVALTDYISGGTISANTWYVVDIPLVDFDCATTSVAGVAIMNSQADTMYFDEVRFTQITQNESTGDLITYAYDYNGDRVLYTVNGTATTTFANKYYNEKGTSTTKQIFANNQLIATIDNGEIYYVHSDHLGGSSVMTDENGDVVQLLDYYPYGGIRLNETPGNIDEKRKAFGHEYDDDSELYYMVARYQNPAIGRFLSVDPQASNNPEKFLKDPQQLNLYSYSRNNPLLFIDPTGETIEVNDANGSIMNVINDGSGAIIAYPYANGVRAVGPGQYWGDAYGNVQGPLPNETWDPVTNSRIAELDPDIQGSATNFINNVELQTGVQLRVTDGYRSSEEQDALYNQSRTNPPTGPWATNARGGESYHNYGLAIDVVEMDNGQCVWNPVSTDVANLGYGQGFEWGGYWQAPAGDYPHFQNTSGQSISDLQKKNSN